MTQHSVYKDAAYQTDDSDSDVEAFPCKLPVLSLSIARNNAVHIKETMNGNHPLPQLTKYHHNRMRIETVRTSPSRCAASAYIPDYDLTKHFLKFPLIKYADLVVAAFVRDTESNLLIPSDIVGVCRTYFVHSEDKAFQLAYKIYTILRALKRPAAQIKVFYVVIAKYLNEKDPSKLKRHFDELKRLEYIHAVDDNGQLYEISTAATVCFQSMVMSTMRQ